MAKERAKPGPKRGSKKPKAGKKKGKEKTAKRGRKRSRRTAEEKVFGKSLPELTPEQNRERKLFFDSSLKTQGEMFEYFLKVGMSDAAMTAILQVQLWRTIQDQKADLDRFGHGIGGDKKDAAQYPLVGEDQIVEARSEDGELVPFYVRSKTKRRRVDYVQRIRELHKSIGEHEERQARMKAILGIEEERDNFAKWLRDSSEAAIADLEASDVDLEELNGNGENKDKPSDSE
jgi:hypothetical protein